MEVPILKQGHYLIASIQSALTDADLSQLREALIERVGRFRARGVIDPQRARQLTEQLLRAIRTNRAKVVVIDITGVAAMDSNVANHLVQTVEASRLLGATVIVTGLSPEIAQTLVTIGVDLSEMATVGDLQGGIEEAERLLADRAAPTTQVREIAPESTR